MNRRYTSNNFVSSPAYHLKKFFALRKKDYELVVPCGKCLLCRTKRANDWRFRLLQEYGTNQEKVVFFTLTFANDSDIEDYKKNKGEYIRRWRQNFKYHYKKSPRYFIIEDIGGRFGRLHLHGLLFGFEKSTTFLRKHHLFWKYGFIDVQWSRSTKSVSYLCNYLTTTNLKNDAKKHGYPLCAEALRYIPRVFVSQGLGRKYLTPQQIKYFRNKCTNHFLVPLSNGYSVSIPRYYRNIIWTEDEYKYIQAHNNYYQYCDILDMMKRSDKGQYIPYFFRQRYLGKSQVMAEISKMIDTYQDITEEYNYVSIFGLREHHKVNPDSPQEEIQRLSLHSTAFEQDLFSYLDLEITNYA